MDIRERRTDFNQLEAAVRLGENERVIIALDGYAGLIVVERRYGGEPIMAVSGAVVTKVDGFAIEAEFQEKVMA